MADFAPVTPVAAPTLRLSSHADLHAHETNSCPPWRGSGAEMAHPTQGPSWGYCKSQILRACVNFWRYMTTKWLQERTNGSTTAPGMPPRRVSRGYTTPLFPDSIICGCVAHRDAPLRLGLLYTESRSVSRKHVEACAASLRLSLHARWHSGESFRSRRSFIWSSL